jgi:hypothetical protein
MLVESFGSWLKLPISYVHQLAAVPIFMVRQLNLLQMFSGFK